MMKNEHIDWGVPDWHATRAYRRYESADIRQSRWEYLRRQTIYRDDWLATGNHPDPLPTAPNTVWSQRASYYGLLTLVDPAWSYLHQPAESRQNDRHTPQINAIEEMVPPWSLETFLKGDDQVTFRDSLARAHTNFQFVAFIDPFLPRKSQFDQLSRQIDGWQQEIGKRTRAESFWVRNLPRHLRLLDARNAGATPKQIANHLAEEKAIDESQLRRQIKAAENAARIHIGLELSRSE